MPPDKYGRRNGNHHRGGSGVFPEYVVLSSMSAVAAVTAAVSLQFPYVRESVRSGTALKLRALSQRTPRAGCGKNAFPLRLRRVDVRRHQRSVLTVEAFGRRMRRDAPPYCRA